MSASSPHHGHFPQRRSSGRETWQACFLRSWSLYAILYSFPLKVDGALVPIGPSPIGPYRPYAVSFCAGSLPVPPLSPLSGQTTGDFSRRVLSPFLGPYQSLFLSLGPYLFFLSRRVPTSSYPFPYRVPTSSLSVPIASLSGSLSVPIPIPIPIVPISYPFRTGSLSAPILCRPEVEAGWFGVKD